MADRVDDKTWLSHLKVGDYDNWFRDVMRDPELANEAAQIEELEAVQLASMERRSALQLTIGTRPRVGKEENNGRNKR